MLSNLLGIWLSNNMFKLQVLADDELKQRILVELNLGMYIPNVVRGHRAYSYRAMPQALDAHIFHSTC